MKSIKPFLAGSTLEQGKKDILTPLKLSLHLVKTLRPQRYAKSNCITVGLSDKHWYRVRIDRRM